MSRTLSIGLLDRTPGWDILLEWTGAPWRVVHNVSELSVERFALIITNRHLWKEEIEAVEAFVSSGGAVLDIGRFLPHMMPNAIERRWFTSVLSGASDAFSTGIPILDLHGRGVGPRQRDLLNGLLGFFPMGRGVVATLGIDPGLMMYDYRARAKRFPGLDGKHPAERVARLTKGEIGLLLRRIVVHLFHEQRLPFVRKRSFPADASNVFCFRVDSDYGSREQIDALYDVARSTSMPMTWFIHTEGHSGWLDRFVRFEGQESAFHCSRHKTFPEKERNLANMQEGCRALKDAGLEVSGYAAPNGIWHHGIAQAIEEQDFLYSSEFGLAYDALPFNPILPMNRRVNNNFYRALQIPVHPISVGNLARVGISDERMIDYYKNVIAWKEYSQEPLIFYHHPTHERWGVVEQIIEAAHNPNVLLLRFGEYAEWWSKRTVSQFEVALDDGNLNLYSYNRDSSVFLDLFFDDGTVGIVKDDGMISLADIPKIYPSNPPESREKHSHLRKFSFTVARRALRDSLIRMGR